MQKKIITFIFISFIFLDIGYSFIQHLQMPLDGDMAESIFPSSDYEKIFQDPFGINVLTKNATYPNPNRFFEQWTFARYFQHVPIFLQKFVSPIPSIYLSCAIAKILIQIALIILLGIYITGTKTVLKKEFLIAVSLIIPLFQTNGYRSYMGIIDPSITYTFSYALPCALLLLFYFPFFNFSFYNKKFITNKIILFVMLIFTVVITLNGPLLTGTILIISLLYFFNYFKFYYFKDTGRSFIQRIFNVFNKIPSAHLFFFIVVSLLSLYSLYIGSHNGNNVPFAGDSVTIAQRYLRLPEGLYDLLTQKIGYPLLLLMIGVNTYLISGNYSTPEANKIVILLKWIGIFSFFYILLLPLGGYRSYRPNIIRYDSIMPITIALIFIYGLSSYFLIFNMKNKKIYVLALICFSAIFTIADKPELNKNKCEIMALNKLAVSKENVVLMDSDCTIMAWEMITDPKDSDLNALLLTRWRITKEKRLYYQK